ncbi:MAG: hypothetical protein IK062_09755 [Selenomonadaceae bacterium]|nr:hypothetical protein [Selenomonadaceae bacterium]
MIIVFIAGMASGDVRIFVVGLRCLLSFCVSSAAVYFLLMIFEMYDESRRKEADKIAKELAESGKAEENSSQENGQGGFQPINPSDIPHA